MTSPELDNLVRIGKLKREPPSPRELRGLLASARERRNPAEYEGHLEHDEQLLADVLVATRRVLAEIEAAPQSGAAG